MPLILGKSVEIGQWLDVHPNMLFAVFVRDLQQGSHYCLKIWDRHDMLCSHSREELTEAGRFAQP
jgi:hypothetical protein